MTPFADRASVERRLVYVPVAGTGPVRLSFTAEEWSRLAWLYGVIAMLHIVGWVAYLRYSADYPAMVGLGFAAYMLGLRHAFDADHIAAIDDTVRFMLHQGRRPLGIGFFFSLGHSTVVLCLSLGAVSATVALSGHIPGIKEIGALIGTTISGVFLWIVGVLNLLVVLDILGVWRQARAGTHDHRHLDELIAQRGLLNRIIGRRPRKLLRESWQMYPLGLLFGLGFDTASEIALLVMAAAAAAGSLPLTAVLCLPVLFAAGMALMDTTDGVLMSRAYRWAFMNPLRRIFYNLATTSFSVVVALVIGSIELVQVLIGLLKLHGSWLDFVAALDLGVLGYVIVGLFLAAWLASVAIWRFGKPAAGFGARGALHLHPHTHADGTSHSHEHVH